MPRPFSGYYAKGAVLRPEHRRTEAANRKPQAPKPARPTRTKSQKRDRPASGRVIGSGLRPEALSELLGEYTD